VEVDPLYSISTRIC